MRDTPGSAKGRELSLATDSATAALFGPADGSNQHTSAFPGAVARVADGLLEGLRRTTGDDPELPVKQFEVHRLVSE